MTPQTWQIDQQICVELKKKKLKKEKKKPKVGKMLRMTPSFQLRRATDRLARFGKERKKQKNNNNQNKRKPET